MEIRFDDRRRGESYEFRGLRGVVEAHSIDQVIPAFESIRTAVAGGKWAAGFVSYEAAQAFDDVLTVRLGDTAPALPLLWFALYDDRAEPGPVRTGRYELTPWAGVESPDRYGQSLSRIQSYIQAGDTYQVNYTYQQSAQFSGDPQAFYADLLTAQSASYSAYLDTGRFQILSASPELFFHQRGNTITCRPMKGTSARGRWPEEDRALLAALLASEKERAENVMIVDLIRNDLGRVARFGTVQVDELFRAEQYETVWQLVSTVSAEIRPGIDIVDLFRALFPCGSVTGAPKVRTMEIIAELESTPRGVYCGAIGMLAPPGAGAPAASFSVAIRTVTIDGEIGTASYGVGGGITHGSRIDQEYEETRAKARVLIRKAADFVLIETMRWDQGFWFLSEHLDRLRDSADYCGFEFDRAQIEEQLQTATIAFPEAPVRVRLSLGERGQVNIETGRIVQVDQPLRVAVDHLPVDPSDWRLFHKTSMRRRYQEARLRHPDTDDVLMVNLDGQITESTIANVIVRLDGKWLTPPISSGCLPGVMRRVLLEAGDIEEAPVLVSDLARAEGLELINSVRLRVPAVLANPTAVPIRGGRSS
ncbi:MAG: aminodeoxychorismate synthase component I [Acidimicrobiia bacterium]|nr:aminodeoxychorismate synthase component I [Acidimicrobiia bacterium]